MIFAQKCPTVSLLLGEANSGLLDEHTVQLADVAEDQAQTHYSACALGPWCALNTIPEFHDQLQHIEGSLAQILSSANIDDAKLRRSFSHKALNPDQFDQLIAEIATAGSAAARAILLELEWPTCKKNYDADVRMEVEGEPVNLEVTLRTDSWADEVAVHMGDILDKEGNQIKDFPEAKSRRTLTDRQMNDLEDAELKCPIFVSDVISNRKNNPPQTIFISDPNDLPEPEARKAYCADGDNPNVESRHIQRCVIDKAQKFNADGFHIVVLATTRQGFPAATSVADALFGKYSQIKHHGLFEGGLYDEICGVIYLPVFECLDRLEGIGEVPAVAQYFVNHNATVKPTEQLQQAVANVFEAEIRHGWVDV